LGRSCGAGNLVTSGPYCPKRGDVVWLNFIPRAGREQAGRRPALTLSHEAYNRKVGLGVFCPITSHVKGYSFEVAIPEGHKVSGAILSDHVKSMDWSARRSEFYCRVPDAVLTDVVEKLQALFGA